MVVGKAIKVDQAVSPEDPGFSKVVDELHGKFIGELSRLYDEHKGEFGWENRPLEIA